MENISINSENNYITNNSSKVKIKTSIEIIGSNKELPIEISADFTNIPEHLHQIYLDSFLYTYNKDINVFDNTKPEPPKPPKDRIMKESGIFDWFTDRFKK